MKKIFAAALALLMILPMFSFIANAKDFTPFYGEVDTKNNSTNAPKIDGIISPGEYDKAVETSFGPSELTYYSVNSAVTEMYAENKASIESRGSHPIGDSTIYAIPTEKGIYFGCRIADTSYGANYVRETQWHGSLFNGESVSIIFRSDETKTLNQNSYFSGDAVRVTVAPFVNDMRAVYDNKRTVCILSGITRKHASSKPDVTEIFLDAGCTADSNGYSLEFLVPWKILEDEGFKGITSYESGKSINMIYQIGDALGMKDDGKTIDWGVFNTLVNSSLVKVSDRPLMFDGKHNYNSIVANSGITVSLKDSGGEDPGESDFSDIKETDYFYEPVKWAVKKNITLGVSPTSFAPNMICSRGQMVTFLYRAAGSPSVEGDNPFTDIAPEAYYYDAVIWAAKNGITLGKTETTFAPDESVTRGQAITFLYRYAKGTEWKDVECPYSDVSKSDYFHDAVIWAYKRQITNGITETTFDPNGNCTRAQIVTFLYRLAHTEEERPPYVPREINKYSTIPVMNITTDGSTIQKEEYIPASVSIDNTEEKYKLTNESAQIRGRGNSTWQFEKKPYRLKFDSKIDLFGNGEAKSWTLIANYVDWSLLRNYLMLNIGSKMQDMPYTSSAVCVDLYMNGEYQGMYTVCEQVQTGKNRVDVKESLKKYSPDEIGYLVELDTRIIEDTSLKEGFDYFINSYTHSAYTIKTPDTEDELFRADYTSYISEYIIKAYYAARRGDWEEVCELIDIYSFADAYICYELSNCQDVMYTSFFLYKDGGGKLCCGPIWDFDFSCGISTLFDSHKTDYLYAKAQNEWFAELCDIPEFNALIAKKLHQYEDMIRSSIADMKTFALEHKDAFEHNFEKWDIMGKEAVSGRTPAVLLSYKKWEQHLDYVVTWTTKSLEYMLSVYAE